MKIVHVVEALAGGVNTYFKDLSLFFGSEDLTKDIQTTVIYSGNRKEVDSQRINEDFSKNINLLNVHMVRGFSIMEDFKSILKLRKILKEINPDVVHLHSSKAGFLGRIVLFSLPIKPKLFYTPHGYAFLRTDISFVSKKIYWTVEKSFQLLFGGETIACGDTEYAIAKNIGKSHLIRNGINVSNVRESLAENHNPVLTIGIVGRITYARNPSFFNAIALRFPKFNFVWIGDGELNDLITAPNIRITGWMFDPKKVLAELNKLDIYIQTSLWEGLPIAVLEAMSLQKPVIATNVIGNKDIVVHGENGFLFNKIEELDHIFQILSDEETRLEFGKKASEHCKIYFNSNTNFKDLVTIYKQ